MGGPTFDVGDIHGCNVAFIFLCLSLGPLAQKSEAQTSEAIAKAAITEARNSRERLLSGMFRANGRVVSQSPRKGRVEGDVTIFCAFDHERKLFRFDRKEPDRRFVIRLDRDREKQNKQNRQPLKDRIRALENRIRAQGGFRDTDGELKTVITGGKYVRTPEKTINYVPGTFQIQVESANKPPWIGTRSFDVRALGMYYWPGLQKGSSVGEIYETYLKQPVQHLSKDSNGVIYMEWVVGVRAEGLHQRKIWFDKQNGFTPIRMELREESDGGAWKKEPYTASKTRWAKKADVWIPITYHIIHRWHTSDGSEVINSYELTLKWDLVNKPIPATVFSWKDFRLPKEYLVVDFRIDENTPVITTVGGRKLTLDLP